MNDERRIESRAHARTTGPLLALIILGGLAAGCEGVGDPVAAEKYFELCDKRNYPVFEIPPQCEPGVGP